jgi:UPF0755 protein
MKWAVGLAFLTVIAVIISIIGLILISGQNPADYARAILARFSLNGRSTDLLPINPSDTTATRFEVTLGSSALIIGQNLVKANLIRDADLFVNYVRSEGIAGQLEAGIYFLTRAQSVPQIAYTLTDSSAAFIPFRILEGWRLEQIADIIDQNPLFGFSGAEFLIAAGIGQGASAEFLTTVGLNAGESLEGFLFPNTYQLPPDITATDLVGTLTDEFLSQVGTQALTDATTQGFSMRQVITLASIVQREAVRSDEMSKIASAYRNRLSIGMKLDADPTVQYALGATRGGWWPQITRGDYTGVISPYNTYLNTGLPAAAIANPGLNAILAVIYPEQTNFFYFRADCRSDGYHDFAVTYEEHLANGC